MADSTNHNVVGTDGIVPSYNPEGLWKTWAINEIFMGTVGKNRYVPKVNDHVIEPVSNTRYLVKSLDQVTLLSELVPLGGNNSLALSSTDLLFATGPGWPSQAYRIYIDDNVFPYRLDVDSFLSIRTVNAAYVKIIHGSIYGEHEVISQVYDASGTFLTDKVGLDLLAVEPGWQNYHIKAVKTCNCTKKFLNGDTLSVVTYSSTGHVLNVTPLAVVNSNFIRDLNSAQRYITHTSIRSPFLSETNPELLLLPLNWTKSSMNIMGVLHYSDGSEAVLPIDGRKFSMRGLDQLLSSIPGHSFDMVLHYALEPTEATYHETSSFNNGINTKIRVELVDPNYSYSVKLFVYPYWDTPTQGFKLRWYMFNLERNMYRDVTAEVKFAANSNLFDGYRFGATQRLQVTLNLRDVMPTYKAFQHTQVVEVSLYGRPMDFPTPWTVKHNLTDANVYGGALKAQLKGLTTISVKSGIATQEEWLQRVYKDTYPLMENPENINLLINPTHFHILHGSQITTFPISDWDLDLNLPVTVKQYDTVRILFTRQVSSGELYLSMAAMNVQN